MTGPPARGPRGTDTRSRTHPATARATDRAVSPVIGAILMFALVLALLAVLQTTAIPALNEALEFQHNERVRTDVAGLDGATERVAATGAGETVTVEAGFRYPPRMFFINPPPVAGTVRTTEPGTVEIDNAAATGETGDYWNGSPRAFETRSIEYVPDYNEYASAPTTVFEPWIAYDRHGNTTRTGEQDLVDGRRIDVVALEGRRSVSRAADVPIDVEPTSAPARTVTVRDDGEPVTLTVPTRLPEDEWRDLLADELDPAADPDDDRYVTGIDCRDAPPDPCGELTLTLERETTYELRLGAVAVGSGAGEGNAAYLTDVDGNATAVLEGGRQRLVVEARDRYDNPVSGVPVTGSVAGEGTVRAVVPVTDAEGRATFVYEAPDDVDGTRDVEPTVRFGAGPPRAVAFDVRVTDRGGGSNVGDGSNAGGGSEPSATITDVAATLRGNDYYDVTVDATDPDGNLDTVAFELRNPDTGVTLDSVTVPRSELAARDAVTVTREVRTRGNRLAEYRIVVTVTDADGATASDERIVDGSG